MLSEMEFSNKIEIFLNSWRIGGLDLPVLTYQDIRGY